MPRNRLGAKVVTLRTHNATQSPRCQGLERGAWSPLGCPTGHPLGENRQDFVCDCSRSERTNLGRFIGRIGWIDYDGRAEITGFEAMRAADTNAKREVV